MSAEYRRQVRECYEGRRQLQDAGLSPDLYRPAPEARSRPPCGASRPPAQPTRPWASAATARLVRAMAVTAEFDHPVFAHVDEGLLGELRRVVFALAGRPDYEVQIEAAVRRHTGIFGLGGGTEERRQAMLATVPAWGRLSWAGRLGAIEAFLGSPGAGEQALVEESRRRAASRARSAEPSRCSAGYLASVQAPAAPSAGPAAPPARPAAPGRASRRTGSRVQSTQPGRASRRTSSRSGAPPGKSRRTSSRAR